MVFIYITGSKFLEYMTESVLIEDSMCGASKEGFKEQITLSFEDEYKISRCKRRKVVPGRWKSVPLSLEYSLLYSYSSLQTYPSMFTLDVSLVRRPFLSIPGITAGSMLSA